MKIDLEKLKSKDLVSWLSSMGIEKDHETQTSVFYKSPMRHEKTASFSIQKKTNRWTDFGANGRSGDIIDLSMLLWNVNFQTAIERLNSNFNGTITRPSEPVTVNDATEYTIKKICPTVENMALIEYLVSRAIDPNKVSGLVGEIYYLHKGKNYFGLAFKNDAAGYEYRNAYYKGCIGNKSFTHLRKGYDTITVFEGFMDYLSLESCVTLKSDVLVLNGCANAIKAIPKIREYQNAFLMLDNDSTGEQTTQILVDNIEFTTDLRYLYKGFKDVNDWLMQKIKTPTPSRQANEAGEILNNKSIKSLL